MNPQIQTNYRTFFDQLSLRIRSRGIRKTARKLGWPPTTLHRHLTNLSGLPFCKLWRLADAVDVPIRLYLPA